MDRTKAAMIIFTAAVALVLGLSAGYVAGSWRAVARTSAERPKVLGVGTELIDTPRDPSGAAFDLTSVFAFTETFFHCVVVTNDKPFVMKTYGLGTVEIGKNQFFMSVDSMRIDRVNQTDSGRVEIQGAARSVTRVGDKYEEAVIPFSAVALDGGPGNRQDSLVLTVFYDNKISPMQRAIFGPEPRFGQATNIRSGDISIAH